MNFNFQVLKCTAFNTSAEAGTALLFFCLIAGFAFGQETQSLNQARQGEFISRLAGGDEEQRLNSMIRIIELFDVEPNSATSQAFTALTHSLQHDSSALVRALSARTFEKCCGEQAIPTLLAALAIEREIPVRKAIIYALAQYRSSQISIALIPFLNDKTPDIRGATAFALAERGDANSLDALLQLLQKRQKDEDAFSRSQAIRALGRIGNHSAIEVLVKSLLRDKSPEVRRQAAYALGGIANKQDVKAIETLHEASLQSDPYLAGIAKEALDKVNLRNP